MDCSDLPFVRRAAFQTNLALSKRSSSIFAHYQALSCPKKSNFQTLQRSSAHLPKCIAGSPPNDGAPLTAERGSPSTEDVFAIDAGRDLFFNEMDESLAIQILDTPFGQLKDVEDRFIAAERLKFFPSEQSAKTIMKFVRRFDTPLSNYVLEDRVARRKAVESLGRHKGAYLKEEVVEFLTESLQDSDSYLIETAVWSLGEIGVTREDHVLERVMQVLENDEVQKRVVVQALLRARYFPALPRLRNLINSEDVGVASASRAAVATMSGDGDEVMKPVVSVLQSLNLNERRSAIEDITLSKYVPAIKQVAVCPNSLVLRTRTIRILLESRKESQNSDDEAFDEDTAKMVDRLIWDHPNDLDLLGMKKETRKSRNLEKNIRQLYKNDALYAYLASKTLAEDHRDSETNEAGDRVLQSYEDLKYFDYFGAYHVYKTLGWLRYKPGFNLLMENAASLPPRFFNHKTGAITALAEIGDRNALPVIHKIADETAIWELKYACLIAAERLDDENQLRNRMRNDTDWIIRARCALHSDFSHLRNSFPK